MTCDGREVTNAKEFEALRYKLVLDRWRADVLIHRSIMNRKRMSHWSLEPHLNYVIFPERKPNAKPDDKQG